MRNHEFLWFDCETSGLDPDREVMLEFAVVLAADDRDGDMTEVEHFQSVIEPYSFPAFESHARTPDRILAEMHPKVARMHTKNGLLAELDKPELTCTIEEADQFLWALAGDGLPSLAGNSVHFDLGFVRKHMPKFASRLSHRVFDVSTLIRAERTWGDGPDAFARRAPAHRALDDVRESLATARAFRARRFA